MNPRHPFVFFMLMCISSTIFAQEPTPVLPGSTVVLCQSGQVQLMHSPADEILWEGHPSLESGAPSETPPTLMVLEDTFITALLTSDGQSWQETFEITLELNAPDITVTSSATSGCAPLAVGFESDTGANNYRWEFENGTSTSIGAQVIHTYEDAGVFVPELEIETVNGCVFWIDTDLEIIVEDSPAVAFAMDWKSTTEFGAQLITENTTNNADSFQWSNNLGLFDDQTEASWIIDEPEAFDLEVCLEASSSLGCSSEQCQEIRYIPDFRLFLPEAFTPNEDGLNDVFKAEILGEQPQTFLIKVWDQWGKLMFQSSDPSLGWTGLREEDRGELPVGIYFWEVEVQTLSTSDAIYEHGQVNLLR